MSARFAPVDVRVDVSQLPENERAALTLIIKASQIIDALYMRQVSANNQPRLLALLNDRTPLGQARLQYFIVNRGPWSELDEQKPFLPGVEARPPQGNFYPADATRSELEKWLNTLSKDEHETASSFVTTIRRKPDGKLTPVP
jgi:hypothetical protein